MHHRVSKLLSTAATSILLAAANASVSHANQLDQWTSWVEVGGFGGSDDASRGELVGFAPLIQTSDQLLFTELRGKAFEQDQQEGNFAIGYRQMLSNGWNAGIWTGVDVRRTASNTTFWQGAAGLELLHPDWDVRLNGYLPFDKEEIIARTQTTTPGSIILNTVGGLSLQHLPGSTTTATQRDLALWGIDGEVGARVPLEALGLDQSHELRLFAGAFRFDHERLAEDIAGPRVRSEWRIADTFGLIPGSRLTLESEYSSDTVRDHRWEAGMRLRIPLSFGKSVTKQSALSAQAARMTEALERDTDIVTSADTTYQVKPTPVATASEPIVDNATNVALTQIITATDPASLAAAVAQGAGTLIIVDGAGGTYNLTATAGQVLNADQTLVGGAGTLTLRGATTGTLVTYTAPGVRPTLHSGDTNTGTGIVTLNNNNHVTGFNITGTGSRATNVTGNTGIRLENKTNVVIENNDIRDMGDVGVYVFGTSDSIRLSENTISNINLMGVYSLATGANFTIDQNRIQDTGGNRMRIENASGNLRVTNNTLTNPDQSTMSLVLTGNSASNAILSGNNISGASVALYVEYTSADDIRFSNNTFANLGSHVLAMTGNHVAGFTADSTGNRVTSGAPTLCSQPPSVNATGTFEITDATNTLRTFTNGCP